MGIDLCTSSTYTQVNTVVCLLHAEALPAPFFASTLAVAKYQLAWLNNQTHQTKMNQPKSKSIRFFCSNYGNCEEELPETPVGRQSVVCWPMTSELTIGISVITAQ